MVSCEGPKNATTADKGLKALAKACYFSERCCPEDVEELKASLCGEVPGPTYAL